MFSETSTSTMGLRWLLAIAACVVACAGADHGGSSLRGALEALQRRQRGRIHGPIVPPPDYESLYEFVPPQAYLGIYSDIILLGLLYHFW